MVLYKSAHSILVLRSSGPRIWTRGFPNRGRKRRRGGKKEKEISASRDYRSVSDGKKLGD